jgi:putative redox protein
MADQLTASVRWTQKLHFVGRAAYAHEVPVDHAPPLGEGRGISPMEVLLMSLAGCSGQTVMSLLEKMRQDVRTFSVTASGAKRDDHPRVFTEIRLEFRIGGNALDRDLIDKAVRLTEEKYCPVWAMLKGNVPIAASIVLTVP